MWHSFKNFQNSRKIVVVRDKNGSRYQIRFDTGYSKIEKSTERLEGGGIDTGWQGGTQIEVSLRCLLAGVCSTLDRLEHTMGWLTGFELPVNRFSRVRLAMTPRRRLDVVAGKNIRFRWCSGGQSRRKNNQLEISNNISKF